MLFSKKNKAEIIFYLFLKFVLNKILGRNGDVLPAHILKKIDKKIFDDFAGYIANAKIPVIIVTGTNGKTTTANIIADTLKIAGKKVCSNSNGANMANGIFGAIMGSFEFAGLNKEAWRLTFRFSADFIVIESDEKVFPYISSKLNPDAIVITNFYRDQLDRYGEVNTTVLAVKNAIKSLSRRTVLVLPSFEPLALFAGYGLKNNKIYYGFDKNFFKDKETWNNKDEKYPLESEGAETMDALTCPVCGSALSSENKPQGNSFLFEFKCEKCGFSSVAPDFSASRANDSGNEIKITAHKDNGRSCRFSFKPAISGDYNAANYLAAYSVLKNFKTGAEAVKETFENFETKFGRSYKKTLKDIEINIDLVKNPAGFNRVLEKITENCDELHRVNILFAFSDRDADGRDVSWIWDVWFEKYIDKIGTIAIAGLRPFDLAVRLKAAGIDKNNITVEHNFKKAFNKIMQITQKQDCHDKKIYILPTYTELLRLKKYI
jgi:UDP-N-acetylmuramyl tripeptide synthase